MSDNLERARALASLGLSVFPCWESGEGVKMPRTKHGFLEATTDPDQIQNWWTAAPEALIGVACGPSGIVVVDVDVKDGKDGFVSLTNAGLTPPDTYWYETASGGIHFVYAAPPGVPGPTKNHKLQDGTRLTGVDRRSGGSYIIWWDEGWPDQFTEFTPAPEWFLNHTGSEGDNWGGTVGEWMSTVGGGRMSPLMRSATSLISQEDFGRAELWTRMVHLIRLASVEGEPGAGEALDKLQAAWLRPPWDQPRYQREWIVSLGNAIQSSGGVRSQAVEKVTERAAEADFSWFDQTEQLAHIRQWAQAQWANPWAGLLVALTRLSADLPPNVQLPRLGSLPRASLNQFSVLVGASGQGKSAYIAGVDEGLWPRPSGSLDPAHTFTPSTGQGLVGYFTERRRDPHTKEWEDVMVNTQALATIDEIDSLEALARQDGSTLLSTLKTLWTGGTTGTQNATQERRRNLHAHTYRLALLAGVQPGLGEVLFNRQAALGGLPQRFVFADTRDPSLSRERGHVPDPGPMPRDIDSALPFPMVLRSGGHEPRPGELYVIPLDPTVVHDLMDNQIAIRLQETEALNGHWMLAKLKVAALLAILHGETEVSRHWFDQAQAVMEHSDRTRQSLVDTIKTQRNEENRAKGSGDAERALAAEQTVLNRTCDRVLEILRSERASLTPGRISPRLTKSQRDQLPAALAWLEDHGRISSQVVTSPRKKEVRTYGVV